MAMPGCRGVATRATQPVAVHKQSGRRTALPPPCLRISPAAHTSKLDSVASVSAVGGHSGADLAQVPDVSSSNGTIPKNFDFVLTAETVAHLRANDTSSIEHFLHALITPAAQLARPPVSRYQVGAVALGSSGAVYVGVNMEFKGAPLNQSIHAEQFLLVNCLIHGERDIKAVAVSAAPCGHCRQFYSELACADTMEFIFGATDEPATLNDLLPRKFGPRDLISDKAFPLLLEPQDNPVSYSTVAANLLSERMQTGSENGYKQTLQRAADAALKAAQQSYTPYTRSPAGIAIITHDGSVFSGSYLESAAYNPSLPPFQAAVVEAVVEHRLADPTEVREVLLAELPSAPISQYHQSYSLTKLMNPNAQLTLLPLCWS